jgi:hypothetical protein
MQLGSETMTAQMALGNEKNWYENSCFEELNFLSGVLGDGEVL